MSSTGSTRVRSQLLKHEFLSEVTRRRTADTDSGVLQRQSDAPAILRGILEIGQPSRCETPEYSRVVRLPVSVVSLLDDGARDGVNHSGFSASDSPVKIPWILFKQRWQ